MRYVVAVQVEGQDLVQSFIEAESELEAARKVYSLQCTDNEFPCTTENILHLHMIQGIKTLEELQEHARSSSSDISVMVVDD